MGVFSNWVSRVKNKFTRISTSNINRWKRLFGLFGRRKSTPTIKLPKISRVIDKPLKESKINRVYKGGGLKYVGYQTKDWEYYVDRYNRRREQREKRLGLDKIKSSIQGHREKMNSGVLLDYDTKIDTALDQLDSIITLTRSERDSVKQNIYGRYLEQLKDINKLYNKLKNGDYENLTDIKKEIKMKERILNSLYREAEKGVNDSTLGDNVIANKLFDLTFKTIMDYYMESNELEQLGREFEARTGRKLQYIYDNPGKGLAIGSAGILLGDNGREFIGFWLEKLGSSGNTSMVLTQEIYEKILDRIFEY